MGNSYGGGIYISGDCLPEIRDCVIAKNLAGRGGGIYLIDSSPEINDCTISENSSSPVGSGGGIYCINSNPIISGCNIGHNTAGYQGGGIYCYWSSPTVTNSNITRNSAKLLDGGGIYCRYESSPTITNCTIAGNRAVEDQQQAWRRLFKSDDVIGIKVNCMAGRNLSSHPHVVEAIVAELQKIQVPAENIIIWDRTGRELQSAGYILNTDGAGVKCYGTESVGYEKNASAKGSFNGRLSKILTQQITALINVPILKNHGGAGVTIAMKNHYGSFHNPSKHHGNMCDPYIADLNSLDEIKAKTKLIVCDATRASCNGGPGYKPAFAWQYSGLLLSCDPVALDTVGTNIIEERRAEIGLPTLAGTGRYPRQLASAAERGLGKAEIGRIDLQTLEL